MGSTPADATCDRTEALHSDLNEPDADRSSRRPADWRIRVGYLTVGLVCALIAIVRGADQLDSWVMNHPRYRFDARALFLDERPAWADGSILNAARRAASRLSGRSILEPTFQRELSAALRDVPWVADVRRFAFSTRGVAADVSLRVPVAWVALDKVAAMPGRPRASSADLHSAIYVDRHGHLLPFAGRHLRLPGIRSRHDAITVAELRVAAREAHAIGQALRRKARASGRAERIWRSWLGVEVHREERGDGLTNTLLTLAFRGADGDVCPIRWGRGRLNARSGDQPFARKVDHLERIFYHHPDWRRLEQGNVAFHQPIVVPRDGPTNGAIVAAE